MEFNIHRYIAAAAVILQLAACGGGGGGGGSDTGSSGGGTGSTVAPKIVLAIVDPATSASKTAIKTGDGAIVTATVTNVTTTSAGATTSVPVAGELVTFSIADAALASMTPTAGTALTDASGVAKVRIDAATFSSAGATKISAGATVSGTAVTESKAFSVGLASVTLINMSANLSGGATSLSPYATTTISVELSGIPRTTPVSISFSSTCASAGKATIDSPVTSSDGKATATYKDNNCAGTDTISATVTGTASPVSIALPILAPTVAALQFISATPSTILLKGTGSSASQENSLVKFKLVDNNNQAVASQQVQISLTSYAGGILLQGGSSTVTSTTDNNGEVTVSVSAGSIPTSVWVNATHLATGFSTQSVKLLVSTGKPVMERFSLAVGSHNIEGWSYDGVTTTASVIASDRVGNPVPDGTGINFIVSGAQISTGSTQCFTTGGTGSCGVTFTSAAPKPISGRVAVTAYAVGEESFRDDNGNNKYDAGEPYGDLGDLFNDADFDLTKDSGEQQINYSSAGQSCAGGTDAKGSDTAWFNPLYDTARPPMVASTCDRVWGSAHVRRSNVIVLSGSAASVATVAPYAPVGVTIGSPNTKSMATACQGSFTVYLKDVNGNALPAGTTVSIGQNTVKNTSGGTTSAATVTVSPAAVPDSIDPTGHTVSIDAGTSCVAPSSMNGSFSLTTTTPKGNVTPISFTITP